MSKLPETLTEHLVAPLVLKDSDDNSGDRREFEAIAVPYGVEVDRVNFMLGTTKLRIEAGAVTFRDDAKVFYGHDWQDNGTPIGLVLKVTEDPAGPRTLSRLWKTDKANEIYDLMRSEDDGPVVLDKVSIGFYITEYAVEAADTDSPVLVILAADVFEISVVPFPQFVGAAVENVFTQLHSPQEGNPMPQPSGATMFSKEDGDKLTASVTTLGTQVEDLGAKFATLGTPVDTSSPADAFNSYGAYVKALAAGDADAIALAKDYEALAYEGGKVADTIYGDTWVGETLRLVEKARKVWNLFDTGVLPAEGTKLEYGKIAENTVMVAEQVAEGDAIVMGNVTIGTDTADVLTFAGGSELSLQQVKRSAVQVVDLHWRALAIAYGKASETYMRGVRAIAPAQEIGSLAAMEASFDGWIDFLVDGAMHLDDKGLAPEYLDVSVDVFKDLAKIREGVDGPFLLNRDSGRINLLDQTGDIAGLKLVITPGEGFVELGNSFALKTFESGGAPARLGPQEDITNLTQAIGVYGFGAVAVQDAKAMVRPAAGV